ncbi:MAG: hypothetical protein ACOX6S_13060 [Clostridia bacterium]
MDCHDRIFKLSLLAGPEKAVNGKRAEGKPGEEVNRRSRSLGSGKKGC